MFEMTLREEGRTLASAGARGGDAAVRAELGRLEKASSIDAAVMCTGGRVIAAEPPSSEARDVARSSEASGRAAHSAHGVVDRMAVPLEGGALSDCVLVGEISHPSFFERPSSIAARVLAVVLISGLVAFLLARYLTRPIRRLRLATRRLAGGDTKVRVAPEIGRGRDEVAALAREFDEMAERIDTLLEAQHRLLRDVSHELRSPLARLHVALELARRKAGEQAAPPLDRIERETERLSELIGEILTVTRLESDGAQVERAPVDVAALVSDVVEDAEFEASNRGRHVVLAGAADASVEGNREVLRRAVENVVRNAARLTDEGLTVEVAVTREGEARVQITVRDRGPGVPEGELEDIFRPFYRVGTARDRKGGGTGIGLAITDRAVRLHGGRVEAKNAEGGGLRVTIDLPTVASA